MSLARVVILWHMHQPPYRDPIDGGYVLPWLRLHALKDYLGMVRVLEETPAVHVTFNLVPSLLDQVEAYASRRADELQQRLSQKPAASLDQGERLFLLRALFRVHPNLTSALPRFAQLRELRGEEADEASLRRALGRFAEADLRDLQVLAKLAWFDRDERARDPTLRELAEKGRGYDEADKHRLAERETALLAEVIPAYRRARERGQIEISASPYYHPILPLLCDTDSHHESHPGAPLPRRFRHPEDARDQARRALERHAELFGARPAGMWPSEGSVSEAALEAMAAAGVRWTASDEGVLERSLGHGMHRDGHGVVHPVGLLYRPWFHRTPAGEIKLLFRDRTLSDLIGFVYSSWDPEDAARDMLLRFHRIAAQWRHEKQLGAPVISVVLDGENCWEYFKDGGRVFLRQLYRGLQQEAHLKAVTVSEALAALPARELPRVHAGSWIHADFGVWIGHADDRRAWDLLGDARDVLGAAADGVAPDALERAWEAYRAACASDWCWWYGDDRSSENDVEFDRLFRRYLQCVYQELGVAVPEALTRTLITTRRIEVVEAAPSGCVRPTLDGEITSPEEWSAAGVHRAPLAGSMQRGGHGLRLFRFGGGGGQLHLLIEASTSARALLADAEITVWLRGEVTQRYRVGASDGRAGIVREVLDGAGWSAAPSHARAAAASVVELSLPLPELPWASGRPLELQVGLLQGGVEIERHPDTIPVVLRFEEVAP